jgi:hypothetical protein
LIFLWASLYKSDMLLKTPLYSSTIERKRRLNLKMLVSSYYHIIILSSTKFFEQQTIQFYLFACCKCSSGRSTNAYILYIILYIYNIIVCLNMLFVYLLLFFFSLLFSFFLIFFSYLLSPNTTTNTNNHIYCKTICFGLRSFVI